jgi:ubiquinone/menaquinone biosynthesis C-methylase UbiE
MGFDRLAPHYDWMELIVAGGLLQRCRLAWLGELTAERVLLAGEGHGRFLVALSQRLPNAKITYLDDSGVMLDVARRRLEQVHPSIMPQVEWLHASLPDWSPPAAGFDLVVTNFFLDCFDGALLKRVMDCLSTACVPGGQWLISDFTVPSHPAFRIPATLALWLMYRFFRVTINLPARALESPFPHMQANGFTRSHARDALFGFLTSQLWCRAPEGN